MTLYVERNLVERPCPMPFSGRTARDERPYSFRGARHHGAGRLRLPCGVAGGHRSRQAGGHRPAAVARVEMPLDRPTSGRRQIPVHIA